MAFIQVPTLIERKRYSDGMGGVPNAKAVIGRRGARKRSRLGSLSSGAMGSLGDDVVAPGGCDPFDYACLAQAAGLAAATGQTAQIQTVSTPSSSPTLVTTPAAAPTNAWGVIGNLATAAGKIINPAAYATYPYPYAQPTSPLLPLLLIGGGIFVVVMLMKK